MNERLKQYRTAYEQCFVPIFVKDGYDTETLIKGCRMAEIQAVEYTLRREDAADVIPTVKEQIPGVTLFCGSTIDADEIVIQLRKKYPQLMTMEELTKAGVDGLVSFLPFSDETIRKYRAKMVLIPSAETAGEALRQMRAGASLIKVSGTNIPLIKACRAAPSFGFCPLFVTGGVTLERMPEVFGYGAVMTAAGFDLTLRGIDPDRLTPQLVCDRLAEYRAAAQKARDEAFPQLKDLKHMSDEAFLDALPHVHPFF